MLDTSAKFLEQITRSLVVARQQAELVNRGFLTGATAASITGRQRQQFGEKHHASFSLISEIQSQLTLFFRQNTSPLDTTCTILVRAVDRELNELEHTIYAGVPQDLKESLHHKDINFPSVIKSIREQINKELQLITTDISSIPPFLSAQPDLTGRNVIIMAGFFQGGTADWDTVQQSQTSAYQVLIG